MAAIDFNPEKKTIEDLFVGPEYYVIPRFQRPYNWEEANLEDFWRDVVHDNEVGYFIGPMVAWRDEDTPIRRIVDGQQRITTIVVMFAVLRDEFIRLGEQQLADGIHRYLEKADRNNELRFTLQTESTSSFLNHAILKNPPDASIPAASEEERALAGALRQIRRLIASETAKRARPQSWLREVRDRLLGLRVIWVEHGDEDDAYIIFETLNSRGKDLEIVDLLKNQLLKELRGTGNTQADTNRLRWDQMRRELEGGGDRSRINPNQFILHWWLSRADYVAQRKLFNAIKKTVSSEMTARRLLDDLIEAAPLYRAALEPASRRWSNAEFKARDALAGLELFGIVQPAPLLLALLRTRAASPPLAAKQLRRTLQDIERYHFQYTIVGQLSSSGGVSSMYAKAARDLHAAGSDPERRAAVLDDFRAKLGDRQPERASFVAAFTSRFFFTNDDSRDKKLIQYALGRILKHQRPATDIDGLTLEHIMPQGRIKHGEPARTVGSLGNLLLVSEELNGKLGNKDFAEKLPILLSEGAPYDIGGVLDRSEWTHAEIEARTELLAGLAYDTVWRLPS